MLAVRRALPADSGVAAGQLPRREIEPQAAQQAPLPVPQVVPKVGPIGRL